MNLIMEFRKTLYCNFFWFLLMFFLENVWNFDVLCDNFILKTLDDLGHWSKWRKIRLFKICFEVTLTSFFFIRVLNSLDNGWIKNYTLNSFFLGTKWILEFRHINKKVTLSNPLSKCWHTVMTKLNYSLSIQIFYTK